MGAAVAVIVLNWKGADDTIACVESLLQSEHDKLSLFICDNASPDDSVARLQNWGAVRLPQINAERLASGLQAMRLRDFSAMPRLAPDGNNADGGVGVVTLIQTGANLGYAGGNNVGLRYALAEGFDYFWVINNDTEVEPDAISKLLERMAEDASIGLCGSTLIYYGRRDLVQQWGGSAFSRLKGRGTPLGDRQPTDLRVDRDDVEARMSFVSGAATMATRRYLERVGLMQEDYFLYWEELDWSMRAGREFNLGYSPQSKVYHKVGASIGTSGDFGNSSALSDYYMLRNRIRVCIRFSKFSLPFVYFDAARDIWRWIQRGRWDRVRLLVRAASGMPYMPAMPS